MIDLRERIGSTTGETSAEVVRRLASGEPPAMVAEGLHLDPTSLVAAVALAGLGPEGSEGPALVQAAPAHPRLVRVFSDEALAALFPGSARPARLALASGLLQILDHWDASHEKAQEADDLGERGSAAYWHLIAHRREPDPGNALYWARRVGRHPIFEALADAARPLLETDPALVDRLIPDGAWSPSAMIDLANRARPGSPTAALARRLQRLEMIGLLGVSVDTLRR